MDTPFDQAAEGNWADGSSTIMPSNADDNYPRDYWKNYWLHGVMSYIMAFWMFGLLGAWSADLSSFSSAITGFAWSWASIDLVAYLPVIIFWHLSGPTDRQQKLNGWLYGF